MMFCTWVRSVFGVITSRSQMSGVLRPSTSALQHLQLARGQRLDGRALGLPVAGLGDALRDRRRSRPAAAGSRPAFAARTVATTSSMALSFVR